jgi:hypothetical protein
MFPLLDSAYRANDSNGEKHTLGRAMAHYRCYFLDAADHIIGVESLDLPDDDRAMTWGEGVQRDRRAAVA